MYNRFAHLLNLIFELYEGGMDILPGADGAKVVLDLKTPEGRHAESKLYQHAGRQAGAHAVFDIVNVEALASDREIELDPDLKDRIILWVLPVRPVKETSYAAAVEGN